MQNSLKCLGLYQGKELMNIWRNRYILLFHLRQSRVTFPEYFYSCCIEVIQVHCSNMPGAAQEPTKARKRNWVCTQWGLLELELSCALERLNFTIKRHHVLFGLFLELDIKRKEWGHCESCTESDEGATAQHLKGRTWGDTYESSVRNRTNTEWSFPGNILPSSYQSDLKAS